LLEKQVEIIEAPRDEGYGHRTLFFKDPEGNILEIYADI
jgi:catechol-2,3-dioxygenase